MKKGKELVYLKNVSEDQLYHNNLSSENKITNDPYSLTRFNANAWDYLRKYFINISTIVQTYYSGDKR